MVENRQASRRKYHIIYETTCTINGKKYRGMHSTDNLDDGYIGSGVNLQASIRAHGKENHTREILEFCPDRQSLKERERELVNGAWVKDENTLNLALGNGYIIGGAIGHQHTEEAKQKIRDKALGRPVTAAARAKISKTLIERAIDEKNSRMQEIERVVHEEVSKALEIVDKKLEEEARPWNLGTHLSEETRRKISIANKGRPCPTKGKPHSDETRASISQTLTGRPWSQARRDAEATKHKRSDETKRKMAEARRRWWATRKAASSTNM